MPFTSQAPAGIWIQPWQDACEETSIAMVDSFYTNQTITKQNAKAKILHIFDIKNNFFGKSLDENTEEITSLINNFLAWSATTTVDPTLDQIKNELDKGHPIIIPAYGKALHNPNFRSGGPFYHVLVIKGYDDEKQEFITNDPGTRRGLDFRYSYDTIMNAIHDFLPKKQTANGQKVMIFTSPELGNTALIDADRDGLNKVDELKYGTNPWQMDTDHDGFADAAEVISGYSPTVAEAKLKNGTFIKTIDNGQIYQLKNVTKHPIVNIPKNTKIIVVSNKFLDSLTIK